MVDAAPAPPVTQLEQCFVEPIPANTEPGEEVDAAGDVDLDLARPGLVSFCGIGQH